MYHWDLDLGVLLCQTILRKMCAHKAENTELKEKYYESCYFPASGLFLSEAFYCAAYCSAIFPTPWIMLIWKLYTII